MTTTSLDSLVLAVLPEAAVPPHLSPRDVLDPDFEPDAAHASSVSALRELMARGSSLTDVGPRLATCADVALYFMTRIGCDRVESIAIVGLNARLGVLFHRVVSRGGVASCPARIADLIRPLVLNAAHGAVLVHNHPSGDPTPSREDVELTLRVRDACALLDIRLVDHVIVTGRDHVSLLDAGLLGPRP